MNPLVSLVTPVYNAMPYLKGYLVSVAAQTWRPLEVILVDDGSGDGSAPCLEQGKKTLEQAGIGTTVLTRPHGGQSAAMNAGIPLIMGEFFTWCDADDWLTPDSIEKKVLWLLEHPDFGMVRSNGLVLDVSRGGAVSESARLRDRRDMDIFEDLFLDQCYCYAGCYMLRTRLLFECYPKKHIPESPEGQNLQLLLPPASRSLCGYLDEKLHFYCRRSSGHSSRARSYQENLRRMENFTALRLELLGYCQRDREKYVQKAEMLDRRNKEMLLQSMLQCARKELKFERSKKQQKVQNKVS